MSKKLALLSVLLFTGATAYADTDTIELDAGTLRTRAGTALVPLNGLLQIVFNPTSASATFSSPTPGSFVNGTDVLGFNLAMNSVTGEADVVFSLNVNSDSALISPTGLDVGEPLLLRWYPGFTVTGNTIIRNPAIGGTGPNTLQVGDQYGEFRSNIGQAGGIAFLAQAGGSYVLNVLTSDIQPGGYAPSTGFANFTVIPEPSTYALLGLGLGGLTFAAMQRRRVARAS